MTIPLTVALTTYNRANYLKEAIQGILNQTYRNFEFLILDNGSTDDTPSVILGIDDKRIRYVRNPPGGDAAFNGASAIKIARGERLIATHDDDIMEPTMLEKQMAMMDRSSDMTAAWTNTSIIDGEGRMIENNATMSGHKIYARGEFISKYPSELLWPIPSALMYDRRKLMQGNYFPAFFDEIYYEKEERHLRPYIRGGDILPLSFLNTLGSVALLNEPLLRYRRHGPQDQHRIDIIANALNIYKVLRDFSKEIPDKGTTQLYEGLVAKFETQHLISNTQTPDIPSSTLSRLESLFTKTVQDISGNNEAAHALIPLAILLSQAKKSNEGIFDKFTEPGREYSRPTHALFKWATLRKNNGNLFSSLPKNSQITILGSGLLSALLINEAREHELAIEYCIDSNTTRQNKTILGLPIHSPDRLRSAGKNLDYVIFSSERDQEASLHSFIHDIDPRVKTLSWKDLADHERNH